MKYRNPLANAHGLGPAKSGLRHWWMQRLTAVVLALLTPFVVYCLAKYGISDHVQLKGLFSQPLFSGLSALYVLALFWHAQLGLQVVVEDYIHSPGLEIFLQIAIKTVYSLASAVAVIAIVRLSLSA